MGESYNLQNIRALLIKGFTDEQLRRLCYDVPDFRSVYDELAQDSSKARIVDRLIEHADRALKLETLLILAKEHNFARYKKHQPYYDSISVPPKHDEDENFQSQREEQASKVSFSSGKSVVEIKIEGDPSTFTPKQKANLLLMLAIALGCSANELNILSVRDGSILLEIEMPSTVVTRLINLYKANDARLRDLGIEQVKIIATNVEDRYDVKDLSTSESSLKQPSQRIRTVRDILETKGQETWSIAPDAFVIDALKLMDDQGTSALVVLDGDRVVGIISERDYARKVSLQGKSSKTTPVREIMTERVVYVRFDHTVWDCMAVMTNKRIRHLPVLDGNQLVGVISIGDVVRAVISEQEFSIQQIENYIQNR